MNDFTCLLRDIPGAEGPCVTLDGRIFMVAPDWGHVLEVLADGQTRVLADTGGIPAGLQLDRAGDLWLADMKHGILRITLDGEIIPEATTYEGQPVRGCNDCAFDSCGNLYFTAPAGSSLEKRCGEVYCRLEDGTVRRLDGGFAFSNGIAVSAGDRTLIVAETFTKLLLAYDIVEPGVVRNKRVWAKMPGHHIGGADGMDYDVNGNLLVANWGGGAVEVFAPDGQLLRRLTTPFASPSNVHFMGPDSTLILITEHEQNGLWRCDYGQRGQRQYGWS